MSERRSIGARLRWTLVGAIGTATLALCATALSGNGVGGILNLGQMNTISGAKTSMQGTFDGTLFEAKNFSGGNLAFGVVGQSSSPVAAAFAGSNVSSGLGVKGFSVSGIGVQGEETSTTSTTGVGVKGLANSPNSLAGLFDNQTAGPGTTGTALVALGRDHGLTDLALGPAGDAAIEAAGPNGIEGSSAKPAGIGVIGTHGSGTGTAAGVEGDTSSTSSNAAGVLGKVTSTGPGSFSAGVRGENNGTGGNGIGVYGSHAGNGWGVYGTSVGGVGVRALSDSGNGLEAENNSATAPTVRARNAGGGPAAAFITSGAPFTVTSSTKVENLNADLLDGRSANDLVRTALGGVGGEFADAGPFAQQTMVTIDAPTDGFVLATGSVSINTLNGGTTSCNPCSGIMRLRETGTGTTSFQQVETFGDGVHEQAAQLATSWLFPVTAGSRTVALDVRVNGTAGTVFFDNAAVSVLYIPFGPSGVAAGAVTKQVRPIRRS